MLTRDKPWRFWPFFESARSVITDVDLTHPLDSGTDELSTQPAYYKPHNMGRVQILRTLAPLRFSSIPTPLRTIMTTATVNGNGHHHAAAPEISEEIGGKANVEALHRCGRDFRSELGAWDNADT